MAPRPNQYAGTCFVCQQHVAIGAGFVSRNPSDTAWAILCTTCSRPSNNGAADGAAKPDAAKASKPPEAGPSKSADLNLLIKLMKTTTIDNDNVSLVAIRKANEWLSRQSLDWEQLLLGKVTVMADPFAEIPAPSAKEAKPPPRDYQPKRPQAPVRPQAPTRPNPFVPNPTPTPDPWKPVTDPFGNRATVGGVDISKPHNPRAARAQRAAAQSSAHARTFTADFTTSTPRKSAPNASDL